MMTNVDTAAERIRNGERLLIAGEEALLRLLPTGDWIGGTIPYFMTEHGGLTCRDKLFVTALPADCLDVSVVDYDPASLQNIPSDSAENGFSVIIIPAGSQVHLDFAQNAPNFANLFFKPLVGWISGVHLSELGKQTPKVVNGQSGSLSDQKAVVMHVNLPAGRTASIRIVNLFRQCDGDTITFDRTGFSVDDCRINGERRNFAGYLIEKGVDTRQPLVANYQGAMVNVSFQEVDQENGRVNLYAPVFPDVVYRISTPVTDYVADFQQAIPAALTCPTFSCNCILNFIYGELEGKRTSNVTGPITFGEVAYQLLNQTLVCLDVRSEAAGHA